MCAWRLLLLATLPALVGVGAGEVVEAEVDGPAFLPVRRAVVAAPGGSAALACRVANLGDKAVSWVRARDLHILAHAGAVFSADPRVRVAVAAAAAGGAVTHTLRLERLRAADAGRYECQLNTEPKLSQIYNLTVTEGPLPRVEVWAEGARTVRALAGSTATLRCAARLAPAGGAAPLRLAWYRDGKPLLPQGGVALDTERSAARASSRLTLAALSARDAGRYACRAAAGEPGEEGEEGELTGEVELTLLVLDEADVGEMEAMQRDESPAPDAAPRSAAARALLAAAAALAALRIAC